MAQASLEIPVTAQWWPVMAPVRPVIPMKALSSLAKKPPFRSSFQPSHSICMCIHSYRHLTQSIHEGCLHFHMDFHSHLRCRHSSSDLLHRGDCWRLFLRADQKEGCMSVRCPASFAQRLRGEGHHIQVEHPASRLERKDKFSLDNQSLAPAFRCSLHSALPHARRSQSGLHQNDCWEVDWVHPAHFQQRPHILQVWFADGCRRESARIQFPYQQAASAASSRQWLLWQLGDLMLPEAAQTRNLSTSMPLLQHEAAQFVPA